MDESKAEPYRDPYAEACQKRHGQPHNFILLGGCEAWRTGGRVLFLTSRCQFCGVMIGEGHKLD